MNYAIIFFKGKMYRPAGFRPPENYESYLARDGKVRVFMPGKSNGQYRTILKEIVGFKVVGDKEAGQ